MPSFFVPPLRAAARKSHVRKLLLATVFAVAGLSFGASPAASAVVCQPTITTNTPSGFMQDSMVLTAALVNPPQGTVPENLDATGCDIGVYYDDGAPRTLTDNNIFAAKYYGVLVKGPTSVSLVHSSVYDIGDHPHGGSQHGIAVAWRNGASGGIQNSQLFDYQKGGVLADGTGTNVTVLSNTIRGLGPVNFIAQNGVQFSSGAVGTINNNFIEDHQYTGCSSVQQSKQTGCTYVVSTGILLISVDQKHVDTKNNTYRDNDANLVNVANL